MRVPERVADAFFFFRQNAAYEMRISDWSSDVCSSDLIVVTEIPYQVNKARMQERIAELVRAKTIEGIADIRDESDRQGLRVVIELRRYAEPEVELNQPFRFSPLSGSVGCTMPDLSGRGPETSRSGERRVGSESAGKSRAWRWPAI